jgi:hypothetical protein
MLHFQNEKSTHKIQRDRIVVREQRAQSQLRVLTEEKTDGRVCISLELPIEYRGLKFQVADFV